MPKPGIPLVNFRILIKGGAESEPAGQAGLAGLTAQLLRRGTSKRTADQFSDELDSLGGTFFANSDDQSTSINAEFLKKDFDAGLDLLADAVLRPTFPQAEVTKILAQRVDGAKSAKDGPSVISQYYRAFYFGSNHPYGRIADELSFGRMRRDDVVSYHRRQYAGKNLIVVVSGDFDSTAASTALAKIFGAMPAGAAYTWTPAAPPARGSAPRLLLIDKPDATQTYFWIGQPGISRGDPDRVPLWLMNTLFGGRFTSLINEALRVSSGLTYGANCSLQQSRIPGSIAINTYTKTETTVQAIDMALDVLKKFHENGITAEQLASIKAYNKGLYPRERLETSDQLASILGEMELFGLNRGEVDDLFSRIDALTLEQANAVIKKYYRTDNLTFVLLGNAAKIRDAAGKYAPKMIEVSVKQPGIVIAQ
jgi:predicted Zn-dependent peptidase